MTICKHCDEEFEATPDPNEEFCSNCILNVDAEDLAKEKKYKDILVQYQGGGYEGCFWEWNYFLFDSEGKFHNVASSGRKGIADEEDAIALLEDEDEDHVYICDLNDEDSIDTFQSEINEGHMIGASRKVNEIYGEGKLWWKCDICEEKVFEGIPEGYCGDGGIAIKATKKICLDCYSIHTCPYCGEFYDDCSEADVEGWDKCIYCITDDEMKSTCKNCPYLTASGCSSDSCIQGFDHWSAQRLANDLGYNWYEWVFETCINKTG